MPEWRYSGEIKSLEPISISDQAVWYPLIPFGRYHTPDGDYFEVTASHTGDMIGHFRKGLPNRLGVPADENQLHHKNPAGAFCWLRDLENRSDGLWALVEVTDEGRKALPSMPYLSAHFTVGAGESPNYPGLTNFLEAAALCSSPWFYNQPGLVPEAGATVLASMSTVPASAPGPPGVEGTAGDGDGGRRHDAGWKPAHPGTATATATAGGAGDASVPWVPALQPETATADDGRQQIDYDGGGNVNTQELQARIDELTTQLAAATASLTERDTQISELQTQLGERDTQIADLQAAAEASTGQLTALAERVSGLEQTLAEREHEATVAAVTNELAGQVFGEGDDRRRYTDEAVRIAASMRTARTSDEIQAANTAFMGHIAANNGQLATVSCVDKPALQPILASQGAGGAPPTDDQIISQYPPETQKKLRREMESSNCGLQEARRRVLGL